MAKQEMIEIEISDEICEMLEKVEGNSIDDKLRKLIKLTE